MQVDMTDEMIARYLSGKATPEEELAVLDYMSENDEHLEDLLTMSAAIEASRQGCHKSKKVQPLWPALSAAASVALLIGVGITLWHNSQSGSSVGIDPAPAYGEQVCIDPAPAYAEQDSIMVMEEEEEL
jgi:hypothetical protein